MRMKILKMMAWLRVGMLYLGAMLVGNVAWEAFHLPLYTVWETSPSAYLMFVVVHCTVGDLMIGASALFTAAVLVGRNGPQSEYACVAFFTVVFGLSYTLFSEWLNVSVRGSWAYAANMPVVPLLGIGLSPILQWIVIPIVSFMWVRTQKIFASPWAVDAPNAE